MCWEGLWEGCWVPLVLIPFGVIWIITFCFSAHSFLQFQDHFLIPTFITIFYMNHTPLSLSVTHVLDVYVASQMQGIHRKCWSYDWKLLVSMSPNTSPVLIPLLLMWTSLHFWIISIVFLFHPTENEMKIWGDNEAESSTCEEKQTSKPLILPGAQLILAL